MKMRYFGVSSVAALIGCATQIPVESDTAPAVENDTVDGQQTIYSVNKDGTWSATAWAPSGYSDTSVVGGATFTGPAGKTRRMGPCLLRRYGDYASSGTNCTTVADCSNSPTTLPSGGFRYCTAPDGVGQKKCFYRPGPPTTYCSGTPALGGAQVAPGLYGTPEIKTPPHGSNWISYACFEGCTATDPSASSQSFMALEPVCGDAMCEGNEDAYNCAEDCGFCGDGICASNEDDCTCQQDCGYNPFCK